MRNVGFSATGVTPCRSTEAKRVDLTAEEPSSDVTFASIRHSPLAGSGHGNAMRRSPPDGTVSSNGISKRRPKSSVARNTVRQGMSRRAGFRTTRTGRSVASLTRCMKFPVSTSSRIASVAVWRNSPMAETILYGPFGEPSAGAYSIRMNSYRFWYGKPTRKRTFPSAPSPA